MNSETKKILSTKDEVIKLLHKYPDYRDNDERLVAQFWYRQLVQAGQEPKNMTGFELLKIYSENSLLTSADCIVRARAKAQQTHPELRGLSWDKRHNIGQEVTQEIHII